MRNRLSLAPLSALLLLVPACAPSEPEPATDARPQPAASVTGLWGGSAGGHLALLLGTMAEPPIAEPGEAFESEPARVAAVVAHFPPTDLARWGTTQVRNQFPAVALDVDSAREYSPLHAVTSDDAPSLILHGDMDELVPIEEGRTMFEALDASGVDADLVTIDGAGHGFFDEDASRANRAMVEWFVRHLAR